MGIKLNKDCFDLTGVEQMSETEFNKAVEANGWAVFDDAAIFSFMDDIEALVRKGETMGITVEEVDMIEKGRKDFSKLVLRDVVDKNGKHTRKWVKPMDDPKKTKSEGKGGDEEDDPHAAAWARHQHNMKVQRMGKEASFGHIERTHGKEAADEVRKRHLAAVTGKAEPDKAKEKEDDDKREESLKAEALHDSMKDAIQDMFDDVFDDSEADKIATYLINKKGMKDEEDLEADDVKGAAKELGIEFDGAEKDGDIQSIIDHINGMTDDELTEDEAKQIAEHISQSKTDVDDIGHDDLMGAIDDLGLDIKFDEAGNRKKSKSKESGKEESKGKDKPTDQEAHTAAHNKLKELNYSDSQIKRMNKDVKEKILKENIDGKTVSILPDGTMKVFEKKAENNGGHDDSLNTIMEKTANEEIKKKLNKEEYAEFFKQLTRMDNTASEAAIAVGDAHFPLDTLDQTVAYIKDYSEHFTNFEKRYPKMNALIKKLEGGK